MFTSSEEAHSVRVGPIDQFDHMTEEERKLRYEIPGMAFFLACICNFALFSRLETSVPTILPRSFPLPLRFLISSRPLAVGVRLAYVTLSSMTAIS